jgi:hypothetical protein
MHSAIERENFHPAGFSYSLFDVIVPLERRTTSFVKSHCMMKNAILCSSKILNAFNNKDA